MTPECREIRRNILHISHASGHGHIPACFSIVEILHTAYSVIRHDPANPAWDGRDLLLLSKGHGALAHYCVLSSFGYFPIDKVATFGGYRSDFGCHADRTKVPGIEASTGSLGHGIGLAVGMALGEKIMGSDRRVFVVIGDGESNEGSVWEAVMVAVDRKLDNLTIIYDDNRSQGRALQIRNPDGIFRAFGCDVVDVPGHDIEALKAAFSGRRDGAPRAIVARTEKGHGCATLVKGHYEWHRKSPDDRELRVLLGELDAQAV
jgi:transketolase